MFLESAVPGGCESGFVPRKRIYRQGAVGISNPIRMSTNAIIPATTLDINKVTFGEVKVNKAGGKSVPIKYNGQSLQIRMPNMTYWGGVEVKDTDNGTAYSMKVKFKDCDPYAKAHASAEAGDIGTLYNFLIDLQSKILTHAVTNSKKLFGKERSEAGLKETFKAIVAPSVEKVGEEWIETGKYAPSWKLKVPVYDGKVCMDVIDSHGKPVEVDIENIADIFPKRVQASLVIQPSIYVANNGFGVTCKVTFAKVSPPTRTRAADVFKDEIEEEVKRPAPAPVEDEEEAGPQEAEVEEYREAPTSPPPAPAPTEPPSAPVKKGRRAVAV